MARLTSSEAYHWLRENGKIGQRQEEVLRTILKYPELTDREIADKLGMGDPNYVRPRRKELVDLGVVVEAGKKQCSITGRVVLAWSPREYVLTHKKPSKPSKLVNRKKVVDLVNDYIKYSQKKCCKDVLSEFKKRIFKLK